LKKEADAVFPKVEGKLKFEKPYTNPLIISAINAP